jgi:hypothetical protein
VSYCVHDLVGRRAIRWPGTPVPPGQPAVRSNDEVSAELACVVSARGSKVVEPASQTRRSKDRCVALCAGESPDRAPWRTTETVCGVDRSISVDQDWKLQAATALILIQLTGVRKRDEHDVYVAEAVRCFESVAHGGRVFGAWQSMDVAVEDHNDSSVAMGIERPAATAVNR